LASHSEGGAVTSTSSTPLGTRVVPCDCCRRPLSAEAEPVALATGARLQICLECQRTGEALRFIVTHGYRLTAR